MSRAWVGLLLGMLVIIDSLLSLAVGGVVWRGAFIPPWTSWPIMFLGMVICGFSIRSIRRGEGKPPVYTAEDAARAKEEMDRLYLPKHDADSHKENGKKGV